MATISDVLTQLSLWSFSSRLPLHLTIIISSEGIMRILGLIVEQRMGAVKVGFYRILRVYPILFSDKLTLPLKLLLSIQLREPNLPLNTPQPTYKSITDPFQMTDVYPTILDPNSMPVRCVKTVRLIYRATQAACSSSWFDDRSIMMLPTISRTCILQFSVTSLLFPVPVYSTTVLSFAILSKHTQQIFVCGTLLEV